MNNLLKAFLQIFELFARFIFRHIELVEFLVTLLHELFLFEFISISFLNYVLEILQGHFVTFGGQVLIELPDYRLKELDVALECYEFLFEFGYFWNNFFVKVLEIVIFRKSLKMFPNPLPVRHCQFSI